MKKINPNSVEMPPTLLTKDRWNSLKTPKTKMKLRIKNTDLTIRILGIYQLLGGIVGLGVTGWLLLKTGTINGPVLFILLTAIGFYSLSIKAGSLLLKKRMKEGLIYSMVNQILQFVAFSVGGNMYKFISGGKTLIGFDFTNGFHFKIDFGLTSEFNFSILVDEQHYFVYVNILAILVLYVLSDIYEELKNADKKVEPAIIEEDHEPIETPIDEN